MKRVVSLPPCLSGCLGATVTPGSRGGIVTVRQPVITRQVAPSAPVTIAPLSVTVKPTTAQLRAEWAAMSPAQRAPYGGDAGWTRYAAARFGGMSPTNAIARPVVRKRVIAPPPVTMPRPVSVTVAVPPPPTVKRPITAKGRLVSVPATRSRLLRPSVAKAKVSVPVATTKPVTATTPVVPLPQWAASMGLTKEKSVYVVVGAAVLGLTLAMIARTPPKSR